MSRRVPPCAGRSSCGSPHGKPLGSSLGSTSESRGTRSAPSGALWRFPRSGLSVRSTDTKFLWTFRIFFIFFPARGRGGVRGARRGGDWFLLTQEGRGVPGGGGAGRVSAAKWGIFWGGWLNIFFRSRNVHQAKFLWVGQRIGQSSGEHFWAFSRLICCA